MSAFPLSALPRCVALRSKHDNSYLRSVHDESHGGSLVELGHSDGGVMNPRARFYLEPSKDHEGFIHVRCCYNNKYWVPQQRVLPRAGGNAGWVIGTADEPEEDLSKPSCTLVKIPIAGEQEKDDGSTCSFLHSELGKYACTISSTSIPSYMHIASHEDEADRQDGGGGLIDAFSVIDVSDQKQLPLYVSFKGDNGCFLVAKYERETYWLQFSGDDLGHSRVLNTTFTNDDGAVRIKSSYCGKFWRASPHWIWADSDDTAHDNPDTLFRVTTGDDFIALRNLGKNNFCRRVTDYWTDCLKANADSITTEARLQCYEPVLTRHIHNVNFRQSEARVYTKAIDDIHSQTVKNQTNTTNKTTLTFTYTSTVATTWSSTVSMKLGVKTTLQCGVPFVVEGKFNLSAEFNRSYSWGETKTEQNQISKQVSIEVPPMKKVTVKAIVSNSVCDVPFSYKQKDVLLNGEVVTKEFTDGMYFGVKTTNIMFDVIEQDLYP